MEPAVRVPLIRQLALEPDSRAAALRWLVDHGLEDHEALFDPDDLGWFVDVLARRLVGAGEEAMCDTPALADSHERQGPRHRTALALAVERHRGVLAAVGESHPARAVAQAARKARV